MESTIKLYNEMNAADAKFTKAVIKQFGKKNSGDMRYRSTKFNEATKAAAEAYWIVSNEYCAAVEAARKIA